MTKRGDVIVIGAGHNGLTCAMELADAGYRVVVLEQGDSPGGMLDATEFRAGFTAPYSVNFWPTAPNHPFMKLRLEQHGLQWAGPAVSTLALGGGEVVDLSRLGRHTSNDDNVAGFYRETERFAAALRPFLERPPPIDAQDGALKSTELMRLLFGLRRIGQPALRELLRIVSSPFYDWVAEWMEAPALRGALAFDAVQGTHAGPRSPGTVLKFLLHNALSPCIRQPVLGSVRPALNSALESRGVFLRTSARVRKILVESGQVTGVVLDGGDTLRSLRVVSTVDPKTTVNQLVGARYFETGFVKAISHVRARGNVARLLLALDAAPQFANVDESQLSSRILLVPDIDTLDAAFDRSKYGEQSKQLALEVSIPSVLDPAIAPEGCHVLSANVIYTPYDIKGGWDEAARANLLNLVIETLSQYAPGIAGAIVGASLAVPPDIEARYGVAGGHWHHGELAMDQFWITRPTPDAARYRLPVTGLYLGGAGAHPGGGITGWSGSHAARVLSEDEVRP